MFQMGRVGFAVKGLVKRPMSMLGQRIGSSLLRFGRSNNATPKPFVVMQRRTAVMLFSHSSKPSIQPQMPSSQLSSTTSPSRAFMNDRGCSSRVVLRSPPRRNMSSSNNKDVDVAPTGKSEKAESVTGANYIGHTVYATPFYKFVLVVTGKFLPHKIPTRVSQGTVSTAMSRFRVMVGTIMMFVMYYVSELAIKSGRRARDGGEESLYDSVTARRIQAEKRQYTRDFEVQKERYERRKRDLREAMEAADAEEEEKKRQGKENNNQQEK
eukprot:m.57419 g.57419  ORF g.57419 m.57419 type:complete len:268 (-) comp11230_c0_seq1:269-1072(-)